jgi:hypothetical protein
MIELTHLRIDNESNFTTSFQPVQYRFQIRPQLISLIMGQAAASIAESVRRFEDANRSGHSSFLLREHFLNLSHGAVAYPIMLIGQMCSLPQTGT